MTSARILEIRNPWAGARVFYAERTGSTMEDALDLHRRGCPPGTVAAAGYQQRGRGRFPTRAWQSEAGKGLLFTVLLGSRPPRIPGTLPLLSGLALAQALERFYGLSPEVKWPNDVLVQGKKIAGILCEATGNSGETIYTVGIGVNCNQSSLHSEFDGRAVSLRQLVGRRVSRAAVLECFLGRFHACLDDGGWREELTSRLYGLGRGIVAALPDGGEVRGVLDGLAEDGALLIGRPGSGGSYRVVYSAEVRFNE